jgi:hypothetical protein
MTSFLKTANMNPFTPTFLSPGLSASRKYTCPGNGLASRSPCCPVFVVRECVYFGLIVNYNFNA